MARASWLLLFFLAWSVSARADTLNVKVSRLASGLELDVPVVAGSGPGEPEFARHGTPLSRITPPLIEVGVLVLGLLLLGIWVSHRPEEGMSDHSLMWFLLTGLVFTLVFGAGCARIHMLFPIRGVLVTFFASTLVFVGVRGLGGYFGFEPKGYMPSACGLAALGMLWSMSLFSSELLRVGVMVRNVDVHELPRAQGGAFMLRGALLQKEFTAVMERESTVKNSRGKVTGRTSHTQLMAPLVFDGWTPAQPVPAWLLCQYDQEEEECGWSGTIQNVIAPERMGTVEAVDVIVEAERSTALRSAPGAKLLEWVADVRARVFEAVLFGLVLPLAFLGVFVVLAVYGQGWDEAPPPCADSVGELLIGFGLAHYGILANGVTFVRGMWGTPRDLQWRERIARSELLLFMLPRP